MPTLNFTVCTAVNLTDEAGVSSEVFKEEVACAVDQMANDHMPVAVLIAKALGRASVKLGWDFENPKGGSILIDWKLQED